MKKLLALPAIVFALSLATPAVASAAPQDTPGSLQPESSSGPLVYEIQDGQAPKTDGKLVTQLNPGAVLACNLGDTNAKVASGESKHDGKIDLKCGTDGWGYNHIRKEHKKDWTTVNNNTINDWTFWDDLMWDASSKIIKDPDFTLKQGNSKRCYTKSIKIMYASDGDKPVTKEFYPTVIVAYDSNKIITSIPTREHICQPKKK